MRLSFWWNASTGSETSVAFHWLPVWFPAQQRVHLVRKDGWRQRAHAAKKKTKKNPKVAFLPTGHREARQSNPSLGNIIFSSSWPKLGDNAIVLQLSVPELGLIYGPATVKINGIVVARLTTAAITKILSRKLGLDSFILAAFVPGCELEWLTRPWWDCPVASGIISRKHD